MSLSRTPVDPEQAALNRLAKVNERRDKCASRPGYLGTAGAHKDFQWVQDGRARIAVSKATSGGQGTLLA